MEDIEIEVLNWAKYNPRTDSKKPTWFRLDNDLATGPGFFDLDSEQKWLWVVILSLVSQKNGQVILWNFRYIATITKISEKKQIQTIDIFEKFGRLRVSRKVTSRDSPATNVRTNEHTSAISDETARVIFDLEKIYNEYPKRLGATNKKKGISYLQKKILNQEKFALAFAAAQNYNRYAVSNGKVKTEFVMQFSKFFGPDDPWLEWAEINNDAPKLIRFEKE